MGEFVDVLIRGGRMSVGFAEQALKGIGPEIFARKPSIGGKMIDTNHPAFVYGHLAIYPVKWMAAVGLDGRVAAAPAPFEELFGAGKECRDDAAGKIYPPMKTITEAFFASHRSVMSSISK